MILRPKSCPLQSRIITSEWRNSTQNSPESTTTTTTSTTTSTITSTTVGGPGGWVVGRDQRWLMDEDKSDFPQTKNQTMVTWNAKRQVGWQTGASLSHCQTVISDFLSCHIDSNSWFKTHLKSHCVLRTVPLKLPSCESCESYESCESCESYQTFKL